MLLLIIAIFFTTKILTQEQSLFYYHDEKLFFLHFFTSMNSTVYLQYTSCKCFITIWRHSRYRCLTVAFKVFSMSSLFLFFPQIGYTFFQFKSFGMPLAPCSACMTSLVSISSTFYRQLLCAQIPKAQKQIDNLTVFFALSRSECVKAAHRTLMELTHAVNFTNIFKSSFFTNYLLTKKLKI